MNRMATLLTDNEIQQKLKQIPDWIRDENNIRREFQFKNFREALDFVNRVGELAESMNHHPDIFIHGYRHVVLTLTTHSASGLTRLDFDLAQKIEKGCA